MARISITLDKAGIRDEANRAAKPVVRSVTRQVLNRSTILCPVDTGRLRGAGRMKIGSTGRGPTGIVEYPVKYAGPVHDGTSARVIRARRAKALVFFWPKMGRVVAFKKVRHPGTRGRPFLVRAAEEIASAGGYRFIRRR